MKYEVRNTYTGIHYNGICYFVEAGLTFTNIFVFLLIIVKLLKTIQINVCAYIYK